MLVTWSSYLAFGGAALYALYLLGLFSVAAAILGGLLVLSLLSTVHSRVVANSAEPAERHQLRAWAVAGFSLALSLGIGLLFISPLDSGNPPFDVDSDGTRPEMWADHWWVVLPLVVAPPLAWVAKKRLGWRSYVAAGALAPLAMAAFAYSIQDERRSQEQAVDVFTSYTGRLNGDPAIRFQVKDDLVVVCAPQRPGPKLLEKLGEFKDYSGFESCLRVVTSAPEGKQVEAGWRELRRYVVGVSDDRFDCFGDIDCGPPGVSEE